MGDCGSFPFFPLPGCPRRTSSRRFRPACSRTPQGALTVPLQNPAPLLFALLAAGLLLLVLDRALAASTFAYPCSRPAGICSTVTALLLLQLRQVHHRGRRDGRVLPRVRRLPPHPLQPSSSSFFLLLLLLQLLLQLLPAPPPASSSGMLRTARRGVPTPQRPAAAALPVARYGTTVMREVPFSAIQFPIFEGMKRSWCVTHTHLHTDKRKHLPTLPGFHTFPSVTRRPTAPPPITHPLGHSRRPPPPPPPCRQLLRCTHTDPAAAAAAAAAAAGVAGATPRATRSTLGRSGSAGRRPVCSPGTHCQRTSACKPPRLI